jgi:hypothetical protein
MKYKVGDRINFNTGSQGYLQLQKIIKRHGYLIVSKSHMCRAFARCGTRLNGQCSGNGYQFENDTTVRGGNSWCEIEERTLLQPWKPNKPKPFKPHKNEI